MKVLPPAWFMNNQECLQGRIYAQFMIFLSPPLSKITFFPSMLFLNFLVSHVFFSSPLQENK